VIGLLYRSFAFYCRQQQAIAPRAARRYAPRRRQINGGKNRGGSTSVRGRIRSPHISGCRRWLNCRQPACLLPRQLRRGTDRRTDRAISKCPSRAGVITMHPSLRGFREREREGVFIGRPICLLYIGYFYFSRSGVANVAIHRVSPQFGSRRFQGTKVCRK